MAIAVDSTTYNSPTNLTSVSINHTVAGANTYMLVGICLGITELGFTFSSGPTYNGVSLGSPIADVTQAESRARVIVYELVAPADGTHAMAFAMSGVGSSRSGVMVRSYTGVHQTTPRGTPATNSNTTNSSMTVTVSSAVDELVSDFCYQFQSSAGMTFAVDSGQTERVSQLAGNGTCRYGSSDEAGAGTVTMSWTVTGDGSWGWATVGVPLKPSGGTLEQEGFRWVQDDGSESASTFTAAQDTSITAAAGSTKRLRVIVNATGDPATKQYKLQWRLSGGSWADVT